MRPNLSSWKDDLLDSNSGPNSSVTRLRLSPVQVMTEFARSRSFGLIALFFSQAMLAATFALLSSRWLGPSDRGVIVLIATLGSLLSITGSFGIALGGRMLLSANKLSLIRYTRDSARLSGVHVFVSAAVGLPILFASKATDGNSRLLGFVAYSVAVLAAYLLREGAHGVGAHRRAVSADVGMGAILCVGVVALKFSHKLDVDNVIWLMAFAAAISCAYLAILNVQLGRRLPKAPSISLSTLIALSMPGMLSSATQVFAYRGERLFLGVLTDPRSLGIYGVAVALSEITCLVSQAMSQIAFGLGARREFAKLWRLQRITIGASSILFISAAMMATPLINLLLGREFLAAVPIFWVLLVGSVPLSVYLLQSAALNGLGDLRGPLVASLWGATTLALGCLILIPWLGSFGAAFSSGAAYTIMSVITWRKFRRHSSYAHQSALSPNG